MTNYRQDSRIGFEVRKREKYERAKKFITNKRDSGRDQSSTRKSAERNEEIYR